MLAFCLACAPTSTHGSQHARKTLQQVHTKSLKHVAVIEVSDMSASFSVAGCLASDVEPSTGYAAPINSVCSGSKTSMQVMLMVCRVAKPTVATLSGNKVGRSTWLPPQVSLFSVPMHAPLSSVHGQVYCIPSYAAAPIACQQMHLTQLGHCMYKRT